MAHTIVRVIKIHGVEADGCHFVRDHLGGEVGTALEDLVRGKGDESLPYLDKLVRNRVGPWKRGLRLENRLVRTTTRTWSQNVLGGRIFSRVTRYAEKKINSHVLEV
jgi:hypothetical protein